MLMARNLFFAAVILIFLTVIFSFLPELSWQGIEDLPVYQPMLHQSSDVVRFLTAAKFEMKIKKVEAESSMMNIDFIVTENLPEPSVVYKDLKNLIFNGFKRFSLLDDIRVRVLFRQDDEDQLLLGVIANRSGYNPKEIRDGWKMEKIMEYIDDHFQVTYGPLWKDANNSSLSP